MNSSILQRLFVHQGQNEQHVFPQNSTINSSSKRKRGVLAALHALKRKFRRPLVKYSAKLSSNPRKLRKRPKSAKDAHTEMRPNVLNIELPLLPRIPSVASGFRNELAHCKFSSSKATLTFEHPDKRDQGGFCLLPYSFDSSLEDLLSFASDSLFTAQYNYDIVEPTTHAFTMTPSYDEYPERTFISAKRIRSPRNETFHYVRPGDISDITIRQIPKLQYAIVSSHEELPIKATCFTPPQAWKLKISPWYVPQMNFFSSDRVLNYDFLLRYRAPFLAVITSEDARRSTHLFLSVVFRTILAPPSVTSPEESVYSPQFVFPARGSYKPRNRHVSLISAPDFSLSTSSRYSSISDASKQSSDYGDTVQDDIVQCVQLSSPNQLASAHELPTDEMDPSHTISSFMKSIVLPAAVVDEIQSRLMNHDAQIAEEVYERKQAQTNAWVEQKLKEEAVLAFEMAQKQHAKALNEMSEIQVELKGWRLIADIEERVHTRMTADLMRQLQSKEDHIERLTAALRQAPHFIQKQVGEVEKAKDRIFQLETAAIEHSYTLEDKDLAVKNAEALARELESERCRLDNEVDAVKIELELIQEKEAAVQNQLSKANQELEESRKEASKWQKMLEEHILETPDHPPSKTEMVVLAQLRQQLDQATARAAHAEEKLSKATEAMEDLRYENRLHLGRLHFETELTEWWVSDKLANVQTVFEENEALKGRFAEELEADPLVLPDDLYVTEEFERPGSDHLARSVALSRAQQSSHNPNWSEKYTTDRIYGVYGWGPDGGLPPPDLTEEEDPTEPEGFWDRYELRKQQHAEIDKIGAETLVGGIDDEDEDEQAFADAESF